MKIKMTEQDLSSKNSTNVWKIEEPNLQKNQGNFDLLYYNTWFWMYCVDLDFNTESSFKDVLNTLSQTEPINFFFSSTVNTEYQKRETNMV